MSFTNRDEIQTGDLLVWSKAPHGGFWLKIVRLMTVSDFGHVTVAWRVDGKLNHFEAVMPRIHVVAVPEDGSFYVLPMSKYIKDADNVDSLMETVGKRYSVLDAIRGYLGIEVKDNDRWQCVEQSNHYYQSKGIEVLSRFLTPTRFVKKLMAMTGLGLFHVPAVKKESNDG